MKGYIFISGLYRLSCGALILAVNWMMAIQGPSFGSLALLVTLTFLPAAFVPLVWKKPLEGHKTTAYALICCGILSFCLYYFHHHNVVVLFNTFLWFFFFILESSWESWFASLSKSHTPQEIDKYSSLSMSVNQASLMIGPIFAAFLFKNTPKEVIFWLWDSFHP